MVKKHIPSILEKLMKNREESRYARMIYVAMALLLILGARLLWMQVVEGNYYKEQADGNRIRHLPQQAARGVMYDRNGIIMAGSRPAYSVIMPVERKGNTLSDDELTRLAALLKVPAEDIKKKSKITSWPSVPFTWPTMWASMWLPRLKRKRMISRALKSKWIRSGSIPMGQPVPRSLAT